MKFRIGTRGSPLALLQTQIVCDALRAHVPGADCEVAIVKTEGDLNRRDSLAVLGGRGVFVREIEQRLLDDEIDLAVHSLKDLPTEMPNGLGLAAIPERADPRDVLVARDGFTLATLPHGARVGSSSQRRSAQLLALRPDFSISDVRGNVDTRLRKLDEGQYDAIVLAAAGLVRMNLDGRITHTFSPDEMLPSPGQGALAVECRSDDTRLNVLLGQIDHAPTRATVTAERAFLHGLGGGCQMPVGALAELQGDWLRLRGLIVTPDGNQRIADRIEGPCHSALTLGALLAESVLAGGGAELIRTNH